MKDLTPTEIADWFRERAKLFNQMANTVESTFKLIPQTDDKTPQLPHMGIVTADTIKKLVAKKQMRVATLASQLSVDELEIEKIVRNPDSGLVKGNRGWISVNK